MDLKSFLNNLAFTKPSVNERTIALVWFITDYGKTENVSSKKICKLIEEYGFGKQNNTRIKETLMRDRKVVKQGKNGFRIHPNSISNLRQKYQTLINIKPIPQSDSVLPQDLFKSAHGYTKKVVSQLNVAYEFSLFDCSAVMCRRLLETLIIESYEEAGIENVLKKNDGTYMMFSGLLVKIEKDNSLGLSRNCIKGLKDFKKLGDLSAHNRRFNALQNDIDRIRDGIRIASEELLHLCKQAA